MTAATVEANWTAVSRRRFRKLSAEETAAWLFLGPSLVAFVIFTAIPAAATFLLTFYRWDFIATPRFVGFENWATLFAGGAAGKSVVVTVIFAVITLPISLGLGLALAIALDRMPFGKVVFRSIFFMPIVTSLVAISFVFQNMFSTETGLINYVLHSVGLGPVPWLTYPVEAILSVSIMMIWSMTGLSMLVYLAGLQQIDPAVSEAAMLDGAAPFQLFFHVTRPMLARSTFFLVVTQTIGVLQTFEAVFVLTDGGPGMRRRRWGCTSTQPRSAISTWETERRLPSRCSR